MIVITAPTGGIGRHVLDRLLASDEPLRVIARDPAKLPASVRERIEVVPGSHGDAEVVNKAFEGADAVFWLLPPNPKAQSLEASYVDFSRPACEAFQRQGVQRVVGISAFGRGTPMTERAGLVTASLAMDDLIASSGGSYRALTMPSFMDNFLQQIEPIKTQGMFFSPVRGDLKAPTTARRDMAAVAAKLLLDPLWSGHGEVPVLGPEDLSNYEMARAMSEVLGKEVRFQQIPFDGFKARLLGRGMSEAFTQGYVDMMQAKNDGLDNAEPRTPENTTPTTFRQWCGDELKPAFTK